MGLLSFLFRRDTPRAPRSDLTPAVAEKIVNAYGAAMASKRSVLADISGLPYSKERIKAALLVALSMTRDANMRERLKAGYVSLADWQAGIGSRPNPFDKTQDETADPKAAAARIATDGGEFIEVMQRSVAEGAALRDELMALGL